MTITFALVEEMEIRFCIFLTDSTDIYTIKKFSMQNIAATQLNAEQFLVYLTSISLINSVDQFIGKWEYFSTAVIFKGRNLTTLEGIIRKLDLVAKSFKKY